MAEVHSPNKRRERLETYVAFLRGVNVGGKNKLPMKDLIRIFCGVGCGDVRSYIQSGNVLFTAPARLAIRLPQEIAVRVEERFGFHTPVLLRSARQLGDVIRSNPFLKLGAEEETLHVMFLAAAPSPASLESLDPDRSPPDVFLARRREIYLRLPNGVAKSKLTNSYFDSKLKTTSSARNWRTVVKLYELAGGISD